MIVKMRWTNNGPHKRVTLFVGVDRDHLANAGTLCLRPDEATAFRKSIRQGSGIEGSGGFSGVLESGWTEAGLEKGSDT